MYKKLLQEFFPQVHCLQKLLKISNLDHRKEFWRAQELLFLSPNWRSIRYLMKRHNLKPNEMTIWRVFEKDWWSLLTKLSPYYYATPEKLINMRFSWFINKQKWRLLRFANYRINLAQLQLYSQPNQFYLGNKNETRSTWISGDYLKNQLIRFFDGRKNRLTYTCFWQHADVGSRIFEFLPTSVVRELVFKNRSQLHLIIEKENQKFWPPLFNIIDLNKIIITFLTNKAMSHNIHQNIINLFLFCVHRQSLFYKKICLQYLQFQLYIWRRNKRKSDIFSTSWRALMSNIIFKNRPKSNTFTSFIAKPQQFTKLKVKRKKRLYATHNRFNLANTKRLKSRQFNNRVLWSQRRTLIKSAWLAAYNKSISHHGTIFISANIKKVQQSLWKIIN